jgi:hypothetical protein
MRPHLMVFAIFAFFVTAGANALAISLPALDDQAASPLQLVQDKQEKKSETLKQKVKRIWREWTGYKFDVGCPVFFPLTHATCTETGKNLEDARAKCQSQNPFCGVAEVRRS